MHFLILIPFSFVIFAILFIWLSTSAIFYPIMLILEFIGKLFPKVLRNWDLTYVGLTVAFWIAYIKISVG